MSVIVSGVLIDPAGEPVSNAQITLTAVANSLTVLNGFSATVITSSKGAYRIALEEGRYTITVAVNGRSSLYGAISLEDTTGPSTLNQLLKQQRMESELTPDAILYFRQVQLQVSNDLVTVKSLEKNVSDSVASIRLSFDEINRYSRDFSLATATAKDYRDQSGRNAKNAALSQSKAAASETSAKASKEAALQSERTALSYQKSAQSAAETASARAAKQTAEEIKQKLKVDVDNAIASKEVAFQSAQTALSYQISAQSAAETASARAAEKTVEEIKQLMKSTDYERLKKTVGNIEQRVAESMQIVSTTESSKQHAATSAGDAQSSALTASRFKDAAAVSAKVAQQNAITTTADKRQVKGFRDEAATYAQQAKNTAKSADNIIAAYNYFAEKFVENEKKIQTLQLTIANLLKKHPQFIYLFPGGTKTAPGILRTSQFIIIKNPFPGRTIACRCEVRYGGIWGSAGLAPTHPYYSGARARPRGDNIIIWSGNSRVIHDARFTASSFLSAKDITSVPYRVAVWTIDGQVIES
ncbi:prophage tail fiber N-terminal domain-containing protein [Yersinia alsatica]|uniref:prophage tail fiber N-terminal domain-containing protein n=1 Tax=Yersinia alsatica TaxID=2890317 RepID=UPI0032EBA243